MHYIEEVKKDIRKMGAEIQLAEDKRAWRQLVAEAKDRLGLQWPQE